MKHRRGLQYHDAGARFSGIDTKGIAVAGRRIVTGCVMVWAFAGSATAQVLERALPTGRLVLPRASEVGQPDAQRRFDLTLDDAIQRALERNLDLAVERINPQVFALSLAEREAFFRPTVSFNFDTASTTNPSATQLDGGTITETDTRDFDVVFDQPVKWGGGNLNVGFDNNRRETNNFSRVSTRASEVSSAPNIPSRYSEGSKSTRSASRFAWPASTGTSRTSTSVSGLRIPSLTSVTRIGSCSIRSPPSPSSNKR